MSAQTLIFEISAHGLGHLAQTAPIIERLVKLRRSLKIVIRSGHPRGILSQFIQTPFEISPPAPEVALVAPSAMTVDLEASRDAYNQLHRDWKAVVKAEAGRIARLRPALVVANVNYVTLAAAQLECVPNLALCCLNWLDVYRFYLSGLPESEQVIGDIASAYAACDLFIQPAPHMPMSDIPRRRPVGVIARRGINRAPELRQILGVGPSTKIVLLTLGGLPSPVPITLPMIDDVHWLLREPHAPRSDVSTLLGMIHLPFIDLVASVDAVVGKDSYGTVAEAACAGVPLVMIPRSNWPESPCLIEWAAANCNFTAVRTGLDDVVGIKNAVCHVLNRATPPAKQPIGVDEAASIIAEHIHP